MQLAQGLIADEPGDGAGCGEEPVVLAHHDDEVPDRRHVDELPCCGQVGCKRLLDHDMEPGFQARARDRDVAGQGGRVQHRLGFGGRDRLLQRFEAPVGRHAGVFAQSIQGVGVGVDVGDHVHFFDVRDHLARPVAAMRTESHLDQTK